LRSPELYPSQPSLSILIAKEWRDILAGHTVWILLLLLSALVGYSYVQAAALYAEASRSAIEHPEVARGLSPLDGIFVPTFGALYLANTFLFPFIAIRTIAGEKQTGSLKLLLQLPCNFSIVILAKVVVLATVWSGMAVICLTAVALWAWSGGHIGHCELANLLAGHFLYAAVVAGLALLAAALAESGATAAILTLAATMAFWVLDFAAVGDGGLLKSLSGLSLTALLRGFEQGLLSSVAFIGALVAATALVTNAGIWLDPRRTLTDKLTRSSLSLLVAVGLTTSAGFRPLYVDTTENARNSFAAADAATLARLDKPLSLVVRLAPEDPRYVDFERNILSKLRRSMQKFTVRLESDTRTGLFDASERYGTILYQYDGKHAESRSTGPGEVLPLIYSLASIQRSVVLEREAYPGYPLQPGTDLAQALFFGLLPLLLVTGWTFSQHRFALSPPRGPSSRFLPGTDCRGPSQGDVP
jgi:ABC-2 type transport system permease protein